MKAGPGFLVMRAVGGQEWGPREQRLSSDAAGPEQKGLGSGLHAAFAGAARVPRGLLLGLLLVAGLFPPSILAPPGAPHKDVCGRPRLHGTLEPTGANRSKAGFHVELVTLVTLLLYYMTMTASKYKDLMLNAKILFALLIRNLFLLFLTKLFHVRLMFESKSFF